MDLQCQDEFVRLPTMSHPTSSIQFSLVQGPHFFSSGGKKIFNTRNQARLETGRGQLKSWLKLLLTLSLGQVIWFLRISFLLHTMRMPIMVLKVLSGSTSCDFRRKRKSWAPSKGQRALCQDRLFSKCVYQTGASSMDGSVVKKPPAIQDTQETQVQSLGQEDPLEEEMATHSSILAWKTPWPEEPGGLQSMRSQRVRHD